MKHEKLWLGVAAPLAAFAVAGALLGTFSELAEWQAFAAAVTVVVGVIMLVRFLRRGGRTR